jgi:hypothetical protein
LFLTSFLYDKYPEQIAQFIPHGEINSEPISAFISPVKLDKDNQPSSSSVFPQSLTYRELTEALSFAWNQLYLFHFEDMFASVSIFKTDFSFRSYSRLYVRLPIQVGERVCVLRSLFVAALWAKTC